MPEATRNVRVPVGRLDDMLAERGVERVDFIKLDAEGAELEVLEGAKKLLRSPSRPALLVEVQDPRARPWGYAAREITQLLARWNLRGDVRFVFA